MSYQIPVSDYEETSGIVFFARMVDKIRLHAAGKLAPDYLRGSWIRPARCPLLSLLGGGL
ncbi:DUF5069 domain-containing protein [Verrucomicrobium spinosum]|uniref:DUF5069 domain-containing protein n=1 Tax=Verrucomicrobium spinosum TaxID=2736 RepID=UPI00094686CC|nr:DUF5069 domain-containing protein [Verrucomicrobium spinosum]